MDKFSHLNPWIVTVLEREYNKKPTIEKNERMEDLLGYVSNIVRFHLVWRSNSQEFPRTIVAKIPTAERIRKNFEDTCGTAPQNTADEDFLRIVHDVEIASYTILSRATEEDREEFHQLLERTVLCEKSYYKLVSCGRVISLGSPRRSVGGLSKAGQRAHSMRGAFASGAEKNHSKDRCTCDRTPGKAQSCEERSQCNTPRKSHHQQSLSSGCQRFNTGLPKNEAVGSSRKKNRH
ncbi:hypothetical protein GCK32_003499 [Trichostrongylus colubriformis]|uniref:Uncharacterized protein n=1 Tax=Trichostrongylus colubriformis TaxID=6319 RepID=A0AAN8ISU1_TRICO